jgi:hypothetical protein
VVSGQWSAVACIDHSEAQVLDLTLDIVGVGRSGRSMNNVANSLCASFAAAQAPELFF